MSAKFGDNPYSIKGDVVFMNVDRQQMTNKDRQK